MKKMVLLIGLLSLVLIGTLMIVGASMGLMGIEEETGKNIANLGGEKDWRIVKTGAEREINLVPIEVNETLTRFCYSYKDKSVFETQIGERDLTSMPITKIEGLEDFTVDKNSIDIKDMKEYEVNCFDVSYPEFVDGMKFRIGWNSIEVESTADSTGTQWGDAENICVSPDGDINIGFEGGGSDVWYANSSDGGETWTSREASPESATEAFNMKCKSNGNLTIASHKATMHNIITIQSTSQVFEPITRLQNRLIPSSPFIIRLVFYYVP